MFKRTTVILAVVMCGGIAYGKANKIKFFTPTSEQVEESGPDADPDGMAILNYASGADKTIIQIMVSDMTPNLSYSVQLTGCPSGVDIPLDALVTDEEGSGSLHQDWVGDVSLCDVELFVGASSTGPVLTQLPDTSLAPYASTAVSGPGTQDLAGDFRFDEDTNILSVRWFGGASSGDPTQTFDITIHEDALGLPGAAVFGLAGISPDSTTSTGRQLDGQPSSGTLPNEFEYSATLPGGFVASAGVTYWLQIGGVKESTSGNFVWTVSSSGTGDGNDVSVRRWIDAGTVSWVPIPEDRAFALDGEVDSTELRAKGVNPG